MKLVIEIARMHTSDLDHNFLKKFPSEFFPKMRKLAEAHGETIIKASDMANRMELGLVHRRDAMMIAGIENKYQEIKKSGFTIPFIF